MLSGRLGQECNPVIFRVHQLSVKSGRAFLNHPLKISDKEVRILRLVVFDEHTDVKILASAGVEDLLAR